MFKVRRALVSVSDKRGLIQFARGLADLGVEILSTGGTCRQLQEAGIEATEVSAKTGFPKLWMAESKRCTRSFTADCWAGAAPTRP
jgi:phosphoribosylaminoimidazolecarboxamide formyltransferase/IMP cyclohydrolase